MKLLPARVELKVAVIIAAVGFLAGASAVLLWSAFFGIRSTPGVPFMLEDPPPFQPSAELPFSSLFLSCKLIALDDFSSISLLKLGGNSNCTHLDTCYPRRSYPTFPSVCIVGETRLIGVEHYLWLFSKAGTLIELITLNSESLDFNETSMITDILALSADHAVVALLNQPADRIALIDLKLTGGYNVVYTKEIYNAPDQTIFIGRLVQDGSAIRAMLARFSGAGAELGLLQLEAGVQNEPNWLVKNLIWFWSNRWQCEKLDLKQIEQSSATSTTYATQFQINDISIIDLLAIGHLIASDTSGLYIPCYKEGDTQQQLQAELRYYKLAADGTSALSTSMNLAAPRKENALTCIRRFARFIADEASTGAEKSS